jgi:hypothetical protein
MTIIYGRNDLHTKAMNKPIGDIDLDDVIHERGPMRSAEVIIFRDRSGRSKVLKNRMTNVRGELYIEVKAENWIEIR